MIFTLPLLYLRLLRYRAALMIWMFLLLGAAYGGGMERLGLDHLWAAFALASSYVFATATNDLVDEDVDRINHPGDEGRPLVTGAATPRELRYLALMALALAFCFGALIDAKAVVVIGAGLLVAIAYSVRPLAISYRTYASPLLLAVGYVVVPYALGLIVEGKSLGLVRAAFPTALCALFLARIALKDFRDRRGDATFGKPTILLRYGKEATCAISLMALLVGDLLLTLALRASPALVLTIQIFFMGIFYALQRLRASEDVRAEQVMIGIGARLGNGLLLSVLGWLLLTTGGAPEEHRVAFVSVVALAYASNFLVLRSRPEDVLIGYKG
jgi:4-hydroxybenzoate polyprenyltransferase